MNNRVKIGYWSESNIDNYYEYPSGFAGSKFFKELKENGKIVASKCVKCGSILLPPRAFCTCCFSDNVEYVDVGIEGYVHTFTISYVDIDGSRLKEPIIWALIKFPGVEGGLIHRLSDVKIGEIHIGMPVKAILRPKEDRIGSILDIICFKPSSKT